MSASSISPASLPTFSCTSGAPGAGRPFISSCSSPTCRAASKERTCWAAPGLVLPESPTGSGIDAATYFWRFSNISAKCKSGSSVARLSSSACDVVLPCSIFLTVASSILRFSFEAFSMRAMAACGSTLGSNWLLPTGSYTGLSSAFGIMMFWSSPTRRLYWAASFSKGYCRQDTGLAALAASGVLTIASRRARRRERKATFRARWAGEFFMEGLAASNFRRAPSPDSVTRSCAFSFVARAPGPPSPGAVAGLKGSGAN